MIDTYFSWPLFWGFVGGVYVTWSTLAIACAMRDKSASWRQAAQDEIEWICAEIEND